MVGAGSSKGAPPTHVDLSLVSNVSDSKTNEEGRENSSPNKPFFMAFPQQSHRINTLFALGTSSCRAFILSAILSLRNCHERNTNTQKSKLKTPPKHNTTQHNTNTYFIFSCRVGMPTQSQSTSPYTRQANVANIVVDSSYEMKLI